MNKYEKHHLEDNHVEAEWKTSIPTTIYQHVKSLTESILERIGQESHLEEGVDSYDEKISGKVYLYRFLFNSFLQAQMTKAQLGSDEVYPTREVSLSRYGVESVWEWGTLLINIPGILTKSTENTADFQEFFSSIQYDEYGAERLNPIADGLLVPNYYYSARNLDQVEYFWKYLQDLVTRELEKFEKIILVGHSFWGILSTAIAQEMIHKGISWDKLWVLSYCTPHGEAALTRKTHFQPARDLIWYQPDQNLKVPNIAFAGEHDRWVGVDTASLWAESKIKILPGAGHSGNIWDHNRKFRAALKLITHNMRDVWAT